MSGWETLCKAQQNSGYSVNGTFAQYVLAQADFLGRIPDQLSFVDAGPILCAGVTTYKGLNETEARPGEWVVISGVGGLGHIAIQYAKAMGLHVHPGQSVHKREQELPKETHQHCVTGKQNQMCDSGK